MAVFCSDAGHGGRDSGAAWKNVLEKDLNLIFTLQLNSLLKKRGHRILTTRKSDDNVPDLLTRCELINQHHAANSPKFDAIISIHCNVAAYKNEAGRYVAKESVRGFYAIYSRESIKGRDLANSIANQVTKEGIVTRHGGKLSTVELGRSLAWIHKTLPPAVLLELGYMTNPEELRLLHDKDYQKRMVRAIVDGIDNYILG